MGINQSTHWILNSWIELNRDTVNQYKAIVSKFSISVAWTNVICNLTLQMHHPENMNVLEVGRLLQCIHPTKHFVVQTGPGCAVGTLIYPWSAPLHYEVGLRAGRLNRAYCLVGWRSHWGKKVWVTGRRSTIVNGKKGEEGRAEPTARHKGLN